MHEEDHIAPGSPTGWVPFVHFEAKQPVPPCHGEEAPKVDNLSPNDANYADMMGEGSDEVAPSPHNQSNAPNQSSGHGRSLEEDQKARVRANPCNIVPFKRPLKNVNMASVQWTAITMTQEPPHSRGLARATTPATVGQVPPCL